MIIKSFLTKIRPYLTGRNAVYTVFSILILLGISGAFLPPGSGREVLSYHKTRCESIKKDGFCDAVKAYFRATPNSHTRIKIAGNSMTVDHPGAMDSNTVTYDIQTGKPTSICGFWVGFATQKGPCVHGKDVERYLNGEFDRD